MFVLLAAFGLMILVPIINWMWPPADDDSTASQVLGATRQITTAQIARGVFWGLWLFVLSQIVIGTIAFVIVITFTSLLLGSRT